GCFPVWNVDSPKDLTAYLRVRHFPVSRSEPLFFLTPSVCSMVLPPIFSGLPREATEITRDTCVAMDSCCRGQMGVGVSANRQIRKSCFGKFLTLSTHTAGQRV